MSGKLSDGQLWKHFHSLWIRYCGVSDETKTLRTRWLSLSNMPYLPLPNIEKTVFIPLGVLDSSIQRKFRRVGFSRFDLETRRNFAEVTKSLPQQQVEDSVFEVQNMFGELQEYLGILKQIYFQRTSSLEIPYYTFWPRSPQKTMGDEILHLAADEVTKCYLKSLRWVPGLSWDGIVSFLYPKRDSFSGGELRVMPYTKLFHLSLSEDGKYFPGTFLFQSHETSHITMYKAFQGRHFQSNWVWLTWARFFARVKEAGNTKGFVILSQGMCKGCRNRGFLEKLSTMSRSSEVFRQCVADVLGIEIGGICSLFALVDYAPCLETLFRVAFVSGYYHKARIRSEEVRSEEQTLYRLLLRIKERECQVGDPRLCLDYLCMLGREAGVGFSDDEKAIVRSSLENLTSSPKISSKIDYKRLCSRFLDLPCSEDYCSTTSGIISHLVKEPFKYTYSSQIANSLNDGSCVSQVDPRLILHVFYMLYRMRAPPSYPATIHSLAFSNTTKNNGEQMGPNGE